MDVTPQEGRVKRSRKGPSKARKAGGEGEANDFLPLEGGPTRKIPKQGEAPGSGGRILYVGRIPHGFYEKEMDGYFKQFGRIKRLRVARNRKTGKSRHYGFIECEDAEVARIVADSMHNYLLFEHVLQVKVVPPDRAHPKIWGGRAICVSSPRLLSETRGVYSWGGRAICVSSPRLRAGLERKRREKPRTLGGYTELVRRVMRRNRFRRKKIGEAGIAYDFPPIVGAEPAMSKKVKFAGEDLDYVEAERKEVSTNL